MEKVILITGASGGMGGAIASFFSNENVKLALHYNSSAITINENERIAHFKADLTSESDVKSMIVDVLERFGRIDVLINNAGISESSISWKAELEDWNKTMAINLTAPFLMSKEVLPGMRSNKFGRIINISSVVAQTGFVGTSAYAASKAGLIGLTKTMSKEVISSGVTVNAVALGYFNVGMISDVPSDLKEQVIESIPAKRLGDPETLCKTIQWLMDDASAYVTGQTINLNGGMFS